uniref:Ig-like domain-containing protein n=1 Tax=Hymenolepis diminuta TaxID=6216 RepID=A0A0R3SBQ3_HYMDI
LSVRSPSPLSEYQQESSNRASPSYFSKNNEPEERASIESEDNLSQRSSRKSSSSPLPISENNDAEKSRTLERRSPIILSEHRRESGNRASLSFMYDRSNRKTSVESEDNFSQKSGRKYSISPPIPKKRGEVPSAHKRSVEQEIKPVERKMSEISCAMPLEKKGTILSHQTQTAEHPEERKVSHYTFYTPSEKRSEARNSLPPQNDIPLLSSSRKSSKSHDDRKSFLLRPQSITANVGETAVFSCVIRPPSGGPGIHRVCWRHNNREIGDNENESPRIAVKVNEPYEGVFQLIFTNIEEGDHGDYEVAALDEYGVEICSTTFHLSVDEKTLYHPTVTNRSSFTITPGEDGLIYQRKYVGGHLIENFKRNKVDLLPQNTPYRRIGGFSHSLPDLCAPDIIHMSKTILETYKMSPSFPRSKQSYLNSSVDPSEKDHDGHRDRSPLREEMYLDSPRLPPNVSVGVGERLEITCFIGGYPIPQVFWFKDGTQLNEHNPDNDFQIKRRGHVYQLIIPSAQLRHEGLWEVIGRNLFGLVMSGSTVHVKTPDRFRSDSASSERLSHIPVSIPLQDSRARSLSTCSLSESSQKRIHLRLNNSSMREKAPEFTQYFHDQIVNVGDNVHFKCALIGTPKPDIRWEHNGEEIQQSGIRSFHISNSDTGHELILISVDTNFAGRYTIIAENRRGVAACSAMLTVNRYENKKC